ncbi:HTH_Tnp_Tc3_2 domain-containing protein [Trichonephila clavipes]|nr:HTH_Tnp_Tc3_2 domain-containing protein [Trichonephila clavipes]
MPRVRSRNVYQHVSVFDKDRIVVYRDCSLSYRNIVVRVGRDPMTVSRIGNRWAQDGNKERRAGSQRPYH